MSDEPKRIRVLDIKEIDEDMFWALYELKTYCENRKNCHDCKIRKECYEIASKNNDNDISCIQIGRLKDGRFVMF